MISDIMIHVMQRRIDLNRHRVYFSDDRATFPLYNLSGAMVGYQRYYPAGSKKPGNDPRDGKYFTRTAKDVIGVWGLESWYSNNTLFICEGIFDAAPITLFGGSAIALLSVSCNNSTKQWISLISTSRKTILVRDNDHTKSGLEKLVWGVYTPTTKDLGEADDREVINLVRKH